MCLTRKSSFDPFEDPQGARPIVKGGMCEHVRRRAGLKQSAVGMLRLLSTNASGSAPLVEADLVVVLLVLTYRRERQGWVRIVIHGGLRKAFALQW